MKVLARVFLFAVALFATLTLFQVGSPAAQGPPEAPKNLKVLPKDMSRREVIGVMRNFSHALGVRCIECHVSKNPPSDRPDDMDYASDDKPDKETARKMMKMVASINDQIGQMGIKDAPQVRCVTCHHGVKSPQTLQAMLMKAYDKGGAAGATDQYRKLRTDYYGSAAYDFSPDALIEVASDVAESKKDFDGALALLKLNLEFTPKDADTYITMGRVQVAKGDKAAGIASYEKALELDPNNRWAKQQLERAKSAP